MDDQRGKSTAWCGNELRSRPLRSQLPPRPRLSDRAADSYQVNHGPEVSIGSSLVSCEVNKCSMPGSLSIQSLHIGVEVEVKRTSLVRYRMLAAGPPGVREDDIDLPVLSFD
jgi:hypothetical protein